MTLELKHLAPYLPYGLPVWHFNKIKKLFTGTGTSNNWVGIQTCIRLTNMHGECMPMMRPLSDLTEEIEHNGEKILPWSEIMNCEPFSCMDGEDIVEWVTDISHHTLTFAEASVIREKLFEWHFDVFGLIDRGLAKPIEK